MKTSKPHLSAGEPAAAPSVGSCSPSLLHFILPRKRRFLSDGRVTIQRVSGVFDVVTQPLLRITLISSHDALLGRHVGRGPPGLFTAEKVEYFPATATEGESVCRREVDRPSPTPRASGDGTDSAPSDRCNME